MKTTHVLPESLEAYRDWVAPTHELLAQVSLSEVRNQLPTLQRDEEWGTGYVVFPPRDANGKLVSDYDKKHAVVSDYTYGNNNWENGVIRTQMLQGAIHAATGEYVQVVGFPNSTYRHAGGHALLASQEPRMNEFNEGELMTVSLGRFTPYSRRHARILDKQLGLTSADMIGMSLGASIALADSTELTKAGVIDLKSSTHIDPATLHAGVSETKQAFGFVGTMRQFFQAVKDTGIPAYTQAQEAGMSHLAGQVFGSVLGTLLDLRIAENTALRSGMAKGNFPTALRHFFEINSVSTVSVAVGTGTRIGNDQVALDLPAFLNPGSQLEVSAWPYAHALTNHSGIVAILAAKNYVRGRQYQADLK